MYVLYILLALVVFGILIFIHELGHFLTARACGVAIKEFSVGMGPKLISWKSRTYDTQYSIRLLPLGGYVSMVGEDESSDDINAFNNKSVWRRILIIIAGPLMNLILGVVCMFIMVVASGTLASNVIGSFDEAAVSPTYGLMVDDRVVKVERVAIHTGNELVYEIMNQGYRPIDLTVVRNGEELVLEDVVFTILSESGATFGEPDFRVYQENPTFGNMIKHSFYRSLSTIKMIWDSLIDLVRGRYGMEAVSGPVGITEQIGEAARTGVFNLLYIFVVISMNLGIFNLLPVPALDGGRLLFLVVEAVRGKPVDPKVEGYVHFVGLVILLAFMVLVTAKDLFGLFI